MPIQLTENAANEVKRLIESQKLDQEDAEIVLRVGVAGGGCSGFSYKLAFDKAYDDTKDTKYTQHGVDVVVDKKSALAKYVSRNG